MTGQPPPLGPPDAARQLAARRERIERIRALLDESELEAIVVSRPEHVRHFSGLVAPGGPQFLVISGADAWLVCDESAPQDDSLGMLGIAVLPFVGYSPARFIDPATSASAKVVSLIDRIAPRGRVGVEATSLPSAVSGSVAERDLLDISPTLRTWRRVKDDAELEAIRFSVGVVERCLASAIEVIRPGVTELDLDRQMRDAGQNVAGDDFQPDWLIGSGPRSALPEPRPTGRHLAPGEPVLLDVYPRVAGYVADLCRTVTVGGDASGWVVDHEAIVAALHAAAATLHPGTTGRDVDATLRDTLTQRVGSRAASMRHHAGHGLGLFAWEEPWIGRDDATPLEPGSVIALEPGLYRQEGGMRVEGMWLVTDDAPQRLDHLAEAFGLG